MNKNEINVYHLIDHKGFGTIHKLLIPLQKKYPNHKIYTPYEKKYFLNDADIKKINSDKNCLIIIHSTGTEESIYLKNFKTIFPNKTKYIFMHVSAEYEKIKCRQKFINELVSLSREEKVCILTPSIEVTHQYAKLGAFSITIQLGIENVDNNEYIRKNIKRLSKYYNKIITTCSSDKDIYKFVKGIDTFETVIKKNNLKDIALIAGIDKTEDMDLDCFNFKKDDFLNVLYHSKMYIQFSRFESYNLTAVEAKQLKVPVLIMDTEGSKSCMNGYVFNSIDNLEQEMLKVLNNQYPFDIIEANYKISVEKETLENFKNSIEDIYKRRNFLPRYEYRMSITTNCNMKCVYCHNEGNTNSSMLTLDQIEKIIENSKDFGLKEIRLTGGDPLIHPQIYQICDFIHKKGLKISINTNLILFNKLKFMIEKGWISRITVGIDYFDKSISKNSSIGMSSKKILDNILELKKMGCSISIATVFSGNKGHIINLVKWCIENKIRIKVIEIQENKILLSGSKEYEKLKKEIFSRFNLSLRTDKLNEINGYIDDFIVVSFFSSFCYLRRCDLCRNIQLRITANGTIKNCLHYSDQDIDIFDGNDIKCNLKKALEQPIEYHYNKIEG